MAILCVERGMFMRVLMGFNPVFMLMMLFIISGQVYRQLGKVNPIRMNNTSEAGDD
ncbi:hypothetical protein [Shewanella surugensis]|uniref:Uncharacterized protein n=1 Tax=Shewanella surugensis TaxID=212020 RepID=A0ABT0LI04_9GAMM|nr:hypothetical protein [Shewanella surugensis]MCL1127295.1 hypothetical protein [Shewanella surugensis]